ncbi:MAG: RHS repeat-associated core domain-containing protein, partial [Candidatus Binatus sp.]|uniref:RHS repeat-associated core domain-containing protein n=1 Tax=Candidatus Binatus sp. TaxID=2811406 RepID=UPI003C76DF85
STLALTDSSGTQQTSYTYDPFGNSAATGQASANPYQFTGRENDGTGLDYYRARYYSPSLQRFIAQDPLKLRVNPEPITEHGLTSSAGRSSRNASAGIGDINLYEYGRDDPINHTDATGLAAITGQSCGEGYPFLYQECVDACEAGGEEWEDYCRELPFSSTPT